MGVSIGHLAGAAQTLFGFFYFFTGCETRLFSQILFSPTEKSPFYFFNTLRRLRKSHIKALYKNKQDIYSHSVPDGTADCGG
jgi:hypothetical protein